MVHSLPFGTLKIKGEDLVTDGLYAVLKDNLCGIFELGLNLCDLQLLCCLNLFYSIGKKVNGENRNVRNTQNLRSVGKKLPCLSGSGAICLVGFLD